MPPARAKKRIASVKPTASTAVSARIDLVTATLESYAARGIFRGFSRLSATSTSAAYRVAWHRNQVFEVAFDAKARSLQFADVLRGIPARSEMYNELKAFVREQQSDALPEHRRIDPTRAEVSLSNRGGCVSLTIAAHREHLEYAVRKLVNLVNEVFLVFLIDGPYFEYMVEAFDLDPDSM